MNWVNCKDKLPPEDMPIFGKYRDNRPIEMYGSDICDEYAVRDDNDDDNYYWYERFNHAK